MEEFYESPMVRPPSGCSGAEEGARVLSRCHHRAGARHRAEYGHLQYRLRDAIGAVALSRPRPACDRLVEGAWKPRRYFTCRIPRLETGGDIVPVSRAV